RVVEQCRAVRSWCEALGGLVQHASGEFAAAESLFSTALADMPEEERCRWSDITPLLDDKLADRYRQLDCASRAAFEKRWWWLARVPVHAGRSGVRQSRGHEARGLEPRAAGRTGALRAPLREDVGISGPPSRRVPAGRLLCRGCGVRPLEGHRLGRPARTRGAR